jgi:5-formyltetrahydrofolate cyclo-ligase
VSIQSKQELRKAILERILNYKEGESSLKSRVILDKFLALSVFQGAKTVLFYASIKGEVDTFTMIEQALRLKKIVALPVVRKEERQIMPVVIQSTGELKQGAYGILEPPYSAERIIAPQEIDLAVVPGVAFDRSNNRLGRGAGYYDRFLSQLPLKTPTVGLAYDFQVVDIIPGLTPHDRPVTMVLTN